MARAHNRRSNSPRHRVIIRRIHVVLLGLLTAGGAALGAQPQGRSGPPPAEAPGGFRHYPAGRELQGARLAPAAEPAVETLRVEGDGQLPSGLRVQRDRAPVVARTEGNHVFRFGLESGGVPLTSASDFVAIVGRNGRLLASRVRQVPDTVDGTSPTASATAAAEVAVAHARAVLTGPAALVASEPSLEIWVDASRRGHLIWSMTVRGGREAPAPFAVRYRVSALDATEILTFENIVRNATVHVQAEMWQLSPTVPTVVAPLSDASVFAPGSGAAVLTDLNGDAVLPVLAAGEVAALLRGPYADVYPAGGIDQRLRATAVSGGGDTTVQFTAPSEVGRAQTTAFFWTTLVNRWARVHLPVLDASPTDLDGIDAITNWPGLDCNAFFAVDFIALGPSSTFCQNTATPTIIAHEMGHGIHFALAPERFDAAYSEGFGDVVAALVTDQPCIGPGFFVGSPTTCLRDLTSVTMWPLPAGSDAHLVGEPYAQFAWTLRTNLGLAPATDLLLGAVAAAPADIPDAVYLSFVVDDDDGLLGTCSPRQRALEAAADSRNLPRPQNCRPAGDNAAPTAHDDALALVEDGGQTVLDLVGNDTDPDGDQLEVSDVEPGVLGTIACLRAACTYTPRPDAHGVESLSYSVVDTYGGSATATVRIAIASVDDVLQIGGPASVQGNESSPMAVAVSVVEPDGPAFSLQWVAGAAGAPAPCTFADPRAASTTMTCSRDGVFPFGVVITQGASQFVSQPATAEILNAHPNVAIVSPAPGSRFAENTPVDVTAIFTDGPTAGPHTCVIGWGDNSVTAGLVIGDTCTGTHTYAAGSAGDRQIAVGVADPGGAGSAAEVQVTITAMSATCAPGSTAVCLALGKGVAGPGRMAFEFSAWSSGGLTTGQFAIVDGPRFRFAAVVQTLDLSGRSAVLRGAGALNGRTGYTFEALAEDRTTGRDALQVIVRDRAGTIVGQLGGEVTRGDLRVGILP